MKFEQLRIFVAVAERQHVTRGARDLNLTQSATSAAIAALEAKHEIQLFNRIGRRIELTEAGRVFLIEAKAILARVTTAEKVLVDLAELRCGSLTLAASQTVANYWLPSIIYHFRARFPGITVSLAINNSEQVANFVQEGDADLGFIEAKIESPLLVASPIADDEMVVVVAKGHPWTERAPETSNDLMRGPWILRERGSGTRSILESALADWGLNPADLKIPFELPSNEAVRAAVEAGAGATAMSRVVVASSLRAGLLVPIDVALPPRRFYALHHKQRYVTKAVEAFLAIATSDPKANTQALPAMLKLKRLRKSRGLRH